MFVDKDIVNQKEKDILQESKLKQNPYTVPEGYFASVEDAVHHKIHNQQPENALVSAFKSGLALACTFAIIFGFGYGAMYLTNTSTQQNGSDSYIVEESYSNTEEFIIGTIGNSVLMATDEEINEYPNMTDTVVINKEVIEQYLIDSDISIAALASLE